MKELVESGVRVRRASQLSGMSKSAYYYKSRRCEGDDVLITALQELAEAHPAYGFRKCYAMLRRQGMRDNHKRVYRVYRLLKLNLRRRKGKRRLPDRTRQPLVQQASVNQVWAMDFMSDSLACGAKVRTFNVMDEGSREGLAIEAASSIGSLRCIRVLERVIKARGGRPEAIRSDNGPEFTSVAFTQWCREQGIRQLFIQSGKPMQNGYMERFNESFRVEVLDMYLFRERYEVQRYADGWLEHYNKDRPHEGLNNKTPREWADQNAQPVCGGTPANGLAKQQLNKTLYLSCS
jgi:putative transposase